MSNEYRSRPPPARRDGRAQLASLLLRFAETSAEGYAAAHDEFARRVRAFTASDQETPSASNRRYGVDGDESLAGPRAWTNVQSENVRALKAALDTYGTDLLAHCAETRSLAEIEARLVQVRRQLPWSLPTIRKLRWASLYGGSGLTTAMLGALFGSLLHPPAAIGLCGLLARDTLALAVLALPHGLSELWNRTLVWEQESRSNAARERHREAERLEQLVAVAHAAQEKGVDDLSRALQIPRRMLLRLRDGRLERAAEARGARFV